MKISIDDPLDKSESVLGRAQEHYKDLILMTFPDYYLNIGEKKNSFLYEDNSDKNYDEFSWTTFSFSRLSDEEFEINVLAINGTIFFENRNIIIKIRSMFPAKNILVNGIDFKYSKEKSPLTWDYDGSSMTLNIYLGVRNVRDNINVNIKTISREFKLITDNFVQAKIKRFFKFFKFFF
jgi:hypothetical protein